MKAFEAFNKQLRKNQTIINKRKQSKDDDQFLAGLKVPVVGPWHKGRYNNKHARKYFFRIEKASKEPTEDELSYLSHYYEQKEEVCVCTDEQTPTKRPKEIPKHMSKDFCFLPAASKELEQAAAEQRDTRNKNSGQRIPIGFMFDHSLSESVASSIRGFELDQSVSEPVTVLPHTR